MALYDPQRRVRDWADVVIEEVSKRMFADYDFPGLKTVDHVCVLGAEKAAWFKDTDDNVLSLTQH